MFFFCQNGDSPLFVAVRVSCTQAIKDLLNSSQADQDVRSGRAVRDTHLLFSTNSVLYSEGLQRSQGC